MNIGIDIDDTITNLQPTLFAYAQKYDCENFNGKCLLDPYGHNTWDMFSWNDEHQIKFWEAIYDEMLNNVPIKPFAKEIINKLKEHNNIYIITARNERDIKGITNFTKVWLDKIGIKYDELHVDQQDKEIMAVKKELDVFIDDAPRNCERVSSKGIKTYIMDSIHNRNYKNENIERVYSWPEFYNKITNK